MGGISRVHGGLLSPKNFAGVNLQDFTLTFWNADKTAIWMDYQNGAGSVPGGALDQIFRNATGNIGTISRVGTLQNTATSATLNFAVEVLGADTQSPSYLGEGSSEDSTYSYGSTYAALQGRIREVGNVTFTGADGNSYTVHLNSATVTAFTY